MNIKWMSYLAGFSLLLAAVPALAWRCDHGLVDVGDTAQAVLKKCGRPDYVYGASGAHRSHSGKAAEERWYYNPGPAQLLRVLHFRGGVLADIDTGGYGFTVSPQRCTPADIRVGMSVYVLAVRCGKPKHKHNQSARSAGGKQVRGATRVRTETWTYDFGSQYLLQNVSISDGQVQNVETASRTPRRPKRGR